MYEAYWEKIDEMRKEIKSNVYPPDLHDKIWKETDYAKANCYAYALNVENTYYDSAESLKSIPFHFGIIGAGLRRNVNFKNAKRIVYPKNHVNMFLYLQYDLHMLGLSIRESSYEEPLQSKEAKILLGLSRNRKAFHFVRQDSDQNWSHKQGWFHSPEFFCYGDENPSEFMLSLGYKPFSYYIISKDF